MRFGSEKGRRVCDVHEAPDLQCKPCVQTMRAAHTCPGLYARGSPASGCARLRRRLKPPLMPGSDLTEAVNAPCLAHCLANLGTLGGRRRVPLNGLPPPVAHPPPGDGRQGDVYLLSRRVCAPRLGHRLAWYTPVLALCVFRPRLIDHESTRNHRTTHASGTRVHLVTTLSAPPIWSS